jgi:hypothetical protein
MTEEYRKAMVLVAWGFRTTAPLSLYIFWIVLSEAKGVKQKGKDGECVHCAHMTSAGWSQEH